MSLSKRIIIYLLLGSLAQCQVYSDLSSRAVNESYSQFELFKNSDLSACTASTTSKRLVPRRGGGGRGGGGGGGGGDSGPPFVDSIWVTSEASFCSNLTLPVILPTEPTQLAFRPWWPTFVIHIMSLLVTYLGLWRSLRQIRKNGSKNMPIPKMFWVQLPFDLARFIAWLVKAIQGLSDVRNLSWLSVVAWLVPWNYMCVFRLVADQRSGLYENHPQELAMDTTYDGKDQYSAQAYPVPPNGNRLAAFQTKSKIFWLSTFSGLLAIVQWFLTLGTVISLLTNSLGTKALAYTEVSRAASDPASILPSMPNTCLAWLKSVDINSVFFSQMNSGGAVSVAALGLQFLACSYALVGPVMAVLRKRDQNRNLRPYHTLQISVMATFISLSLSAIGVGLWVYFDIQAKGRTVEMWRTTDLNTTGGCTFAAVDMNRRWGYWDVSYNLASRAVYAALAVS